MKRTESTERPNRIEKLGHSLYSYNYDIIEVERDGQIHYEFERILFDHIPNDADVINRIITEQYPEGEEMAIQRKGIVDNTNEEFVTYHQFIENLKSKIRAELNEDSEL